MLEIDTRELVILSELLLRGPQTNGELRNRAGRMHPLETTEVVKNILDSLMNRPEPLARELPPATGDRASRYMQLLCPNLHPLNAPAPASISTAATPHAADSPDSDVLRRIERLETQVAELRRTLQTMAQALGDPA